MDDVSKEKLNQSLAKALHCFNSGKLEDAIFFYREILSIVPNDIAALNNMGLILLEQKEYDAAIGNFQRAILAAPNTAQLHHNLGLSLHKQGRLEEAIESYQRALALDAEYKEPLQNLGAAFKSIGNLGDAASCYKRLLELAPYDANAKYMLDSLAGTNQQKTAPREFVTGLFDDYADHFEEQLVQKLAYQIPAKLKQAFVSFLGNSEKFESLLDLGCGTGLVAEAFHDLATCLTGVDLSEKMLDQARKKGIYGQLYKAEIRDFLKQPPSTYDLVVAADVLVYLGRLDDIFALVAKTMTKGGYFLFSTEDNPDAHDFYLLQSGRYGHGPMYIQSMILQNNFLVRLCRPDRIRKERGNWLGGNIYVLEFMGNK